MLLILNRWQFTAANNMDMIFCKQYKKLHKYLPFPGSCIYKCCIINQWNFTLSFISDDHSRVKLLETTSDYINASYLEVRH